MTTIEGTWHFEDGTVKGAELKALGPEATQLVVDSDGSFHGKAGCNNIMGKMTFEGDTVSFGPIASTKMMCEAKQMAFEDSYLAALGAVTNAEIDGDKLTLAATSGDVLKYKRG